MASFEPLSDEELAARQDELKDELLKPVDEANRQAIDILSGIRRFELPAGSGKWYTVERVPYFEGGQLYDIANRIREFKLHPEWVQIGIFNKILDQAMDIVWGLCIPDGLISKILKKVGLLRNPLRRISDAEAADLLGFCLARRMTSAVKFHFPASQTPTQNR